ncbi:ABC transporter permease subunit [Carnobacteriaceae bacterium zg-ZUI252]|nr:ABC transporter permease subunit [Carnobacteriaceae bacterium zg-ZUI252]MBS4770345.1 ABC transporter permease subunit [Carnobacteriaceae bacterium zg-ZUI240]
MKRYLLKKLLWLIPQMILVSFICFVIIKLMPTDPAEASLRVNNVPLITPELLAQRRMELGLDQPFFTQYINWLMGVFRLDFGRSYILNQSVIEMISPAILPTVALASVSLVIIIVLSLTLGVSTALYHGTYFDKIVRWVLFLLTSAPSFWIGLTLVWVFGVILKWLPTSSMTHPLAIVLPSLTLALTYLSTYIRLIRGKMIEQETENYVLYAKVRGLSSKTILRYVIKNSLQSSIASMSMSIPKLLSGTVVIENIFAWPGLGRIIIEAIFNKDYPVMQAYIFMMAILFILFGTVMDIVMYRIDPRLRTEVGA